MTDASKVTVHAATIEYPGLVRELASRVQVGAAFKANEEPTPPFPGVYMAVWDTGATGTCITKTLADTLALEQVGMCMSHGVTGAAECRTFLISLFLPNGIAVPEIEVSDCEDNIGCDILIGMDIIGMGDFAVSNHGHTAFTFRVPSVQTINFVTQKPNQFAAHSLKIGRNAPCPCGSGKKYKHCHGK